MLMVIDVGNLNIVIGVYDGNDIIASWRMTTHSSRTADETGIFIHSMFDYSEVDADNIDGIIISSVVPDIMYSLSHGLRKYFGIEPMIVNPKMKTGINLAMDNPNEMGADRVVNLVAAYYIYGGPALVISYGTATTFDVIDKNGEFVTALTAPGIQVCTDALYERAAQLPKIEIKKPKSIIAKNTVDSIQSGIILGHIGETIYIINQLKKELNFYDMKIIATGGLAKVIDDKNEIFDIIDSHITLKGLRILYDKNK